MRRLYPLGQSLAAQIVARRRALRWSQNRLALEAGMTEALIAKLETNRLPITPEHRRAIEVALARNERGASRGGQAVTLAGVL
jgi:transcriptional regulator with XRE-family HTH domain